MRYQSFFFHEIHEKLYLILLFYFTLFQIKLVLVKKTEVGSAPKNTLIKETKIVVFRPYKLDVTLLFTNVKTLRIF